VEGETLDRLRRMEVDMFVRDMEAYRIWIAMVEGVGIAPISDKDFRIPVFKNA